MKFLAVVVLALAALAQAEPEADPAYLYGSYYGVPSYFGYPYGYYGRFYGRSAYGYGLPGGYTHVDRLHKREADPQFLASPYALPLAYNNLVYPTAPAAFAPVSPLVYNTAPIATAPVAAPIAPVARVFTPRDCVTADGCQVRALKEAGLAKREAEAAPEAEAEAEAEALFYRYYNGYSGYYPYGFYNGFYNYPYSSYYNYPYSAYTPYVAAPVAPAVKTVVEAPVVKAAPVVAAPAPVATPFVYASAPVVAPVVPKVTPVVEETAKPVTYTHLGAHPIHPTTVLEKTSRVVGHQVTY